MIELDHGADSRKSGGTGDGKVYHATPIPTGAARPDISEPSRSREVRPDVSEPSQSREAQPDVSEPSQSREAQPDVSDPSQVHEAQKVISSPSQSGDTRIPSAATDTPADPWNTGQENLSSAAYFHDLPEIPPKIRQMRRLYEYGDGSWTNKCRNFYRQGRFMEYYEDDQPWNGTFRHYFTTYHDLNLPQLRGYFTWRTGVRKGKFTPISPSLAYLYLYELLSGIGTTSPEDAIRKMQAFGKGFIDSGVGDPGIGRNLRRWMLEYAVIHGLPAETARSCADPELLLTDKALEALRKPETHTDEEIFRALSTLDHGKTEGSPVLTADLERGRHLFAAVWREGQAQYRENGKDLFTACFDRSRLFEWRPLANAVYWDETTPSNTDYVLDESRSYQCRHGAWKEKRYERLYWNLGRFRALLHETDRELRRYLGTGHYLRPKPEEAWAAPFVQAVIEEDRRQREEAAWPKITIDFSHLSRIRTDAAFTRDSLLTEDELDEEAAVTPAGNAPVRWKMAEGGIGQSLPVENTAAPDDQAQKQMMAGNVISPGEMAAGTEREQSERALTSEREGTAEIAGLSPAYADILRKLVRGEPVTAQLKAAHLMPSIVADEINEALFDEIGDNVVEWNEEELTLVEDYRGEVEELLQ